MKMVHGGHLQRPNGNTEGRVLDLLEFFNSRGLDIGEPDGCGVCEEGSDQGFVSGDEGFLLLAPGGASEGFENAESFAGICGYVGDVGGEGEVGVESDSQHSGSPVERKWGS